MRDSFVFYRGFYEAIEEIPDERDRYRAYKMICEYAFNGTEPNGSGICNLVFKAVKPQIDKSNRRYEESRKTGSTGGRPPVNINAETIAELRNKGLTMEQIAEVFGVSKRTLYYKLKEKECPTVFESSLKDSERKSAKTSRNNVQKRAKTSCANCSEIAQGFCTPEKEQNTCYISSKLNDVQMCKNLNVNDNDNVNVKERYSSARLTPTTTISKEKSCHDECSAADIISLFGQAKDRTVTPLEKEILFELAEKYSEEAVTQAVRIAVLNDKATVSYIGGILKNKAKEKESKKPYRQTESRAADLKEHYARLLRDNRDWAERWEYENRDVLREAEKLEKEMTESEFFRSS